MFIAHSKLILHPAHPSDSIDEEVLTQRLTDVGLIADKEAKQRFQTGEQFLSHIIFLGCSPNIELYPQSDKPYCYIEIPITTTEPKFVSGVNIKLPRCPNCKQDLEKLPEILGAKHNAHQNSYFCPQCQQNINPLNLNWRKSACFARNFIIINNIYESEAVPEALLLENLKESSGFRWKYCYVRSSPDHPAGS